MEELNLIYSYFPLAPNLSPSYNILHFFSRTASVDRKLLCDVFNKKCPALHIGPFEKLSDLNDFALKISDRLDAPKIYTLSAHDFNTAIMDIEKIEQFHDIFPNFGLVLKNPNFKESTNFLSKIFKD